MQEITGIQAESEKVKGGNTIQTLARDQCIARVLHENGANMMSPNSFKH